jgi:hypothetical protein
MRSQPPRVWQVPADSADNATDSARASCSRAGPRHRTETSRQALRKCALALPDSPDGRGNGRSSDRGPAVPDRITVRPDEIESAIDDARFHVVAGRENLGAQHFAKDGVVQSLDPDHIAPELDGKALDAHRPTTVTRPTERSSSPRYRNDSARADKKSNRASWPHRSTRRAYAVITSTYRFEGLLRLGPPTRIGANYLEPSRSMLRL